MTGTFDNLLSRLFPEDRSLFFLQFFLQRSNILKKTKKLPKTVNVNGRTRNLEFRSCKSFGTYIEIYQTVHCAPKRLKFEKKIIKKHKKLEENFLVFKKVRSSWRDWYKREFGSESLVAQGKVSYWNRSTPVTQIDYLSPKTTEITIVMDQEGLLITWQNALIKLQNLKADYWIENFDLYLTIVQQSQKNNKNIIYKCFFQKIPRITYKLETTILHRCDVSVNLSPELIDN